MKMRTLAIGLVVTAIAAMAQYSINWSTIDGGGGTMSGGNYMLRGTIGQPDAASMDGGDFVVRGGFWVPQAVQVGGAPWLNILCTNGVDVVVSWILADPGWVLQETFNLQSNWVDCVSGSTNPISISISEAAMFYRLRKE